MDEAWSKMLEEAGISSTDAAALRARLVPAVARLRRHSLCVSLAFGASRLAVSVCTLLVPSLVSLQSSDQDLRWLMWSLGLAASSCNACASIFGLDRAYYGLRAQLRDLDGEAWLFLMRAGRYRQMERSQSLTLFVERCEGMLRKANHAETAPHANAKETVEKAFEPEKAESRPSLQNV